MPSRQSAPQIFCKRPSDRAVLRVDLFSGALDDRSALSVVFDSHPILVFTDPAIDLAGGWISNRLAKSGQIATVKAENGLDGETYAINFTAALSDGDHISGRCYLKVRN